MWIFEGCLVSSVQRAREAAQNPSCVRPSGGWRCQERRLTQHVPILLQTRTRRKMGRLMDSIMAAVGLKPSDRVTCAPEAPKSELKPSTRRWNEMHFTAEEDKFVSEIRGEERQLDAMNLFRFRQSHQSHRMEDNVQVDNSSDEYRERLEALNKMVPFEEGLGNKEAAHEQRDGKKETDTQATDCAGCRFVTAGGGVGLSAYLCYGAYANPRKFAGVQLAVFRAVLVSVAACE